MSFSVKYVLLVSILISFLSPTYAGKPLPEASITVVGYPQSVIVSPDISVLEAQAASRLWTENITAPDASFVKAHIRNLNLKPGDELILRSASSRVVETLTGRGPKNMGTFWTLSAFGESMTVEFHYSNLYTQPPFEIDQIIAGDASMLASKSENDLLTMDGNGTTHTTRSICAPADFEDVMCYQNDPGKWGNITASVGVMTVGGNPNNALFCSGSNISASNRLLTNQHCIETQAQCNNAEFVFKFYRQGCNNGAAPNDDWVSFRCDQVLAQSPFVGCDAGLSDLDYTLASVIGDPSSQFGFVEVDPNPPVSGEDVYIVQHPAGRPHEITHGGGADFEVDGTVLRYYNTLDTEGGSSGSPIYRDADDKLIGLHHCGGCATPGVGNRGMLISDIYPAIESFLCSSDVTLTGAGIVGLTEINGNGDAIFDPTETWELTPQVRNIACAAQALAVTATGTVDSASTAGVSIISPNLDFGDIDAGTVASSTAPLQFQIDGSSSCGSNFELDINNLDATNGAGPVDVNAIYSGTVGAMDLNILFSEDFSNGLTGWTVIDGGTGTGPAQTWTTSDPGNRGLLTPPAAIADSDEHGSGNDMDEELISPVIDASGATSLLLEFNHNFRWFDGSDDEKADVDVRSSATGGAWVNITQFAGASATGFVSLDITPFAATDLQIRFHYYDATFEWWWAIDDVAVVINNGFICSGGDEVIIEDGFES